MSWIRCFVTMMCVLAAVASAQASSVVSSYSLSAFRYFGGSNSIQGVGGAVVSPIGVTNDGTFCAYGMCNVYYYDQAVSAQVYGSAPSYDIFHLYSESDTSVTFCPMCFPYSNYGPIANAGLGISTIDTIWFGSSTLPTGTPVSFLLTATLHSTLSAAGNLYCGAPGPNAYAGLEMTYWNGNQYGADMFAPLVHTSCGKGGDSMTFSGIFQSVICSDTNSCPGLAFKTNVAVDTYSELSLLRSGVADNVADASNTAHISIQVLTPGVTFESQSGAQYSAVPEPSSWLLLGSGVAGVLGMVRRRTRT